MTLTTADLFRVPLGLLWCKVWSKLHHTHCLLPINSLLNSGPQGLPDSPVKSISSESRSSKPEAAPHPLGKAEGKAPSEPGMFWQKPFSTRQSPLLSSGTDSMTWFRSGNHDGQTPAHQAGVFCLYYCCSALLTVLRTLPPLIMTSAGKSTLIYHSSPAA